MKYGRDDELEADIYGMKYMQRAGINPRGMPQLQKIMADLSKRGDSNWLKLMTSTHPPSVERITRAQAFLSELDDKEYDDGCERFQKKTHRLKQTAIAYENYEQALAAFNKDDLSVAAKHIDSAIAVEAHESLFYGLRARLHQKKNNNELALADLDKAISLNPDYWQHYLLRGQIKKQLGIVDAATNDFQDSAALLPTVEAYYSLGDIALMNKQQDQAVTYFLDAWEPDTPLGVEAGKMAARLDIHKHPERYLETTVSLDAKNKLLIRVTNIVDLPISVHKIELLKGSSKNYWKRKPFSEYPVSQNLKTGESFEVKTDVGPVKAWKLLYKYRARVTSANIIKDTQKGEQ